MLSLMVHWGLSVAIWTQSDFLRNTVETIQLVSKAACLI